MAKHNVLVKYTNPINSLNITQLSQLELNVFVALISTVKNKGTQSINLSFNDFRQLARVEKNIAEDSFNDLVIGTFKKIGAGSIALEIKDKFLMFPLFQKILVDKSTKKIKYNVSNEFVKYFNNFAREYTMFPLFDFTAIKGKYAKIIYKQLMQYVSTGRFYDNYDHFVYETLGVPTSTVKANINSKFIKANVDKLRKLGYLKDLSVSYTRTNNKFTGIEFTWEPISSKDIIRNSRESFDEKEYDSLLKELAEDTKKKNAIDYKE